MKWLRYNKIIFVLLVFSMSLILLRRGLNILEEALITTNLYFYEDRVNRTAVDAIVIERRSLTLVGGNPSQEYAIFRFSINVAYQGLVPFINEDRIDGNTGFEKLQVGERIKVQYVTDHPNISEIIGTNPKVKEDYLFDRFAFPILLHLGLGFLLLVIALIAIASSLRTVMNARKHVEINHSLIRE